MTEKEYDQHVCYRLWGSVSAKHDLAPQTIIYMLTIKLMRKKMWKWCTPPLSMSNLACFCDLQLLVMACLSLASKVQEHSVKLGDVVNTCYRWMDRGCSMSHAWASFIHCRCLHKDKPPLEVGGVYWKLKESVGKYELLLLRAIKFNLKVVLPHPVSDLSILLRTAFLNLILSATVSMLQVVTIFTVSATQA